MTGIVSDCQAGISVMPTVLIVMTEEPADLGLQLGMVLLDGQEVVCTRHFPNSAGDLLLAAHRVGGDDRAHRRDHPDQLGEDGDLVCLLRHAGSTQDNVVLHTEDVHRMQRLEPQGSRASGCLPIHGDDLALPFGERWARELTGPVQE